MNYNKSKIPVAIPDYTQGGSHKFIIVLSLKEAHYYNLSLPA